MFSEELNGKNPEEMETEQLCKTVEQEEPEEAVSEMEETAAEAPEAAETAEEEMPEEETSEEEESEEATEEEATEEEVTEAEEPEAEETAAEEIVADAEETAEEQPAQKQCPLCGIKEKIAGAMQKLRGVISAKKESAVEENSTEEAAEDTAVEEETTETAEEETAMEETGEATVTETETPAPEQKIVKKPADAFIIEGAENAEEASAADEKPRKRPADAFLLEEIEEPASCENETEADQQVQESLFVEEEEPAPAPKKIKPLHLGLAIAGGVILLGVLVFLVLHVLGVDLKPRGNDLFYKDAYTVEEQLLEKKADDVVATLGDKELTVSALQLYYIDSIYAFYTQNYYYLDYMGLDLAAPLSEQECSLDNSMTWEQYFLDAAIKSWQSYVLVDLMADEDSFEVSKEVQDQIDSMAGQLESIAISYGYENASDYLSTEMAPGVTVETYLDYNEVFHVSYEYLNTFYEEDYPTETEIHNFYQLHKNTFQDNGIVPNMGLISNVRHILIQPMGGTLSEDGLETVYSEDEWNTALSEAKRILEAWKAGEATEDSFAVMANTYSEDGGSNTTGGLYEAVDPFSNYVPEFLNWAIDSSRQAGDTEIVKTSYGYHIMYFISGQDYFNYIVGEQLVTERIQTRLTDLKEEKPIEINFKKVALCEPVM